MNSCIRGAKSILDRQIMNNNIEEFGIAFSEYQKVFFTTNENIKDYLNLINYNTKENALSVMSSGDHIFNLITNNILNINTFDTNKLTEYYVLGLKRSLILKYTYKEYLNIISILINKNTKQEIINQIIYDLLPFMDKKYRIFWKEIIDYNHKEQKLDNTNLNLIYMLFVNIIDTTNLNNYLLNEINYNKLKDNINKSNINFKYSNALDLDKLYNEKFDIILLSNILDYFYKIYGINWKIDKLNEYINKLHKITNEEGIIFVNYIFNYYENKKIDEPLILMSDIDKNDLENYIIKKLPLYNLNNNKKSPGIILSKKIN